MTPGELWRRIVNFAKRDSNADDLRDEMRLHLELRAEVNLGAGMTEAGAREAAHRKFGNAGVHRERSRDQWGFDLAEQAVRDFRFAVRRLGQRPAFTAAVIGILALGVGATTAMFSAVDAAMLRPLPFPRSRELVMLKRIIVPFDPGTGAGNSGSLVDVVDAAQMHDAFSSVAVYASGGLNIDDSEHPVRAKAGVVSGLFFETFGVPAAIGRTIADKDAIPNGPNVVVLSYGLWQRHFGGTSVLGKTVSLSGSPYEVIGVMPRGFGFPDESDLWIPMTIPNTFATFSAFRGFLPSSVVARLAPGELPGAAAARLLAAWEQKSATSSIRPEFRTRVTTMVAELKASGTLTQLQRFLAGDTRTALFVLLGATLMLLLVACANVTNLLLSQAAARRHEIAVRAVLGASRGRIVRQLLIESVVLAAGGTCIGVALAPAALGAMRALLPAQLSGVSPATIDLRVLGFAAAIALLAGIGFGLWPALGTTRDSPAETIKSGARTATRAGAGRARRMLVGAELAVTVVLLVGSLLMLRSFDRIMSVDRGMKTDAVGTLEIAFPKTGGSRAARLATVNGILARLAGIPGITATGAVNDLPLNSAGGIAVSIHADSSAATVKGDDAFVRRLMATGSYFSAMGIQLKRGRLFTIADDSLAPPVAVISEAMAKAYWPGRDAIGHTFSMGGPVPVTVVGVVSDVRERRLDIAPTPQMYFSIANETPANVAIVARGSLAPAALLARMKEAVHAVDPSQAVFNVRTMDDVVDESVAPRRTNTMLISAFALLALVLSAIGMYAVVSYTVTQRTREFGIRAALGATGGALVRLVTGEMAWVCAAGLAIGVGGAWALSRLLTSMIYGVSLHDPWTFALAPAVLLVPAAIAAVLPARRAAKVNPSDVMRAD